jgi:AcrR family transcriptional regulator
MGTSFAMGTNERRQRQKEELRQKILEAARELFAKRGYEAVTMREIAARIEYSATALYGHFADKETLVRELCRQDFARFAQRFMEVAQVPDLIERLCRAGLAYMDFARQFPQHYRLMFLTELPPTPPQEGERDDPQQNAYVFLRSLVSDLMESGALRAGLDDVDLVSQTVWATMHGAAALELNLDKNKPWLDFRPRAERVAAALELVAQGILREPEKARRTLASVLGESSRKKPARKQK